MLVFFQDLTQRNPGVWQLSTLLQTRSSARFWAGKSAALPADREYEIYIAHHYGGLITNQTTWSSWMVMSMIKGEARKFAEQSVADYPAPAEEEIAKADAAVGKYVPAELPFSGKTPRALPVIVLAASLLVYVGLPAVIAALLFRGGAVLLIAGVTYVKRDGALASRLRLLWRAMVVWSPVFVAFCVAILAASMRSSWQPWLAVVLFGLLAAVSVALPTRGLQDRLAGTWPVSR
jgi:hypothetical protein